MVARETSLKIEQNRETVVIFIDLIGLMLPGFIKIGNKLFKH